MKNRFIFISLLVLTSLFYFVSCEEYSTKEFDAILYLSIPDPVEETRMTLVINGNSYHKEEGEKDYKAYTEILEGTGELVEQQELETLKNAFPNPTFWQKENYSIWKYKTGRCLSIQPKKLNMVFSVKIDEDEYRADESFGLLTEYNMGGNYNEFRNITFYNTPPKTIEGLFLYDFNIR